MRHLRRCLPALLPVLALLLASTLLAGGPRAYAEGEKPTPPGTDPGMGDPGMAEPGMDDPGMGGDEGGASDDDDDVPMALGEKIKISIKKGVAWLKARQLPDGSWGLIEGNAVYGGGEKTGNEYKHPAGATALALYTLLKCKEPVDDPVVKKGFNYLRAKQKTPQGAYEASMMLLAVTAVADPFKKISASEAQGDKVKFPGGDWREWAQKLHDLLISKRQKAKTLGWRYMVEGNTAVPPGGPQDLSSTQLAALGLLAAERCGIKTDSKVWNELITFAMGQQADDGPEWDRAVYDRAPKGKDPKAPGTDDKDKGRYAPPAGEKPPKDKARGFAYIKNDSLSPDEGAPTGGMTACGIGTIMMARYILMKRDDAGWKNRDQKAVQQSVYDGCAWFDANYETDKNPQKRSMNIYYIYYLYCTERAFDLIGNRLIGKHAWYEDMATQLVGRQDPKGFWNSKTTHKPEEVLDTCFALLFLHRSTKGGIPYGSITGGGDEPPADNRGK